MLRAVAEFIGVLVAIGIGAWVLIILINGARDRIRRINENKRKRRMF